MRVLFFLLIVSLALAIRPAKFSSHALSVGPDGTSTLSVESNGHHITQQSKYQESVIDLDQVASVMSVECHDEGATITFQGPVTQWEKGRVLIGGTEWGCQDADGPAHVNVKVLTSIVDGSTLFVTGSKAKLGEIFRSFDIKVREPQRKRGTDQVAGQINYNPNTRSARNSYLLFQQTCDTSTTFLGSLAPTPARAPQAADFCAKGGTYNSNATCSNCYVTNTVNIDASFTSSSTTQCIDYVGCVTIGDPFPDQISFSLSGKIVANLEFSVTAPVRVTLGKIPVWKGVSDVFNFGAGNSAVTAALENAVTLSIDWANQGTLKTGVYLELTYKVWKGTSGKGYNADHTITTVKPTGSNGGMVGLRLAYTVGPKLQAKALGHTMFSADFTAQIWVQLDVSFALPSFTPNKPLPTSRDVHFFLPDFVKACNFTHYLEWTTGWGVTIDASIRGDVGGEDWNIYTYIDPKPLAKGCLLPRADNTPAPLPVRMRFNRNINSLLNTTNGKELVTSLLSFDLKKLFKADFIANITFFNDTASTWALVSLPTGTDFPLSANQWTTLQTFALQPANVSGSVLLNKYAVADNIILEPGTGMTSTVLFSVVLIMVAALLTL